MFTRPPFCTEDMHRQHSDDILEHTPAGMETVVRLGEPVARSLRTNHMACGWVPSADLVAASTAKRIFVLGAEDR